MHSSRRTKSEVLPGKSDIVEDFKLTSISKPMSSVTNDYSLERRERAELVDNETCHTSECMGEEVNLNSTDGESDDWNGHPFEPLDLSSSPSSSSRSGAQCSSCGCEGEVLTEGIEENSSFAQLAAMNVNCNGKTVSSQTLDQVYPTAFLVDDSHLKKIKNIHMGEVPLVPVGMGLSGSGMQLYVKLDPSVNLRKEKLTSAVPGTPTKTRKPRVKKQEKSKNNRTAEETEFPISTLNKRPAVSTNDVRNDQDIEEPEAIVVTPDIIDLTKRAGVKNNSKVIRVKEKPKGTRQLIPQASGQKNHCSEKFNENLDGSSRWITDRGGRHGHHDDTVNNNSITTDRQRLFRDEILRRTEPGEEHESCPRCMLGHGETNVSTNAVTETPESLPRRQRRECVSSWDESSSRHPYSAGFSSRDLPLKPPNNPNNADPSRVCRKRHYQPPHNVRLHSSGHRHRHRPEEVESHFSSDDDDFYDTDHNHCEENRNKSNKGTPKEALDLDRRCGPRKAPKQEGHSSMDVDDQNSAQELTVKQEPDCAPIDEDVATSSSRYDFDSNGIPSTCLDAKALVEFTSYTRNVRKDLKQHYKVISQIMRKFNDDVVDRNLKTLNDNPGESQRDNDDNESDDKERGHCVIM